MKTYKTYAIDKSTGQGVFIESEYASKQAFIDDLRRNGYKVNDRRVAEKEQYNHIIEQTDATATDFKQYEKLIKEVVDSYNDWTRSDLQGYIEAQIPDFIEADKVLQEIDTRLAKLGVGI